MREGRRTRQAGISGWFVAGAIFSCVIALGLVVMMAMFAKNPTAAPPGVLRYLFLAAPALLLVVILVTMVRYIRRRGVRS